ncbi:GNAT family N-acetyltransferase [Frigoriglobus tundricola]|uniref:Histone acetyltransferase HPA2 n=1 Tax=Frigoriglobus tundricola TaxID=2774151 RepID=A0A6M5Z2N4_9BACT|nr:GNAT family N-acetyltransferase [Frigoriglobus tundricola]QJW99986.1 Histone acetyltransferase HPA2 [Frigoriglobus tundricola]
MIRPTTPAETDALVALAEGTGVFKPLELEALREVLDDYHAGPDPAGHKALTLERDGHPVGFAYYAPTAMTDRTWHLYWIFVQRTGQARGLGSRLLRHVEDDIIQSGGRLFLIETSSLPSYELTRRFYLKHGYEQAATIKDFYTDGDDQVIFRKRLVP